MEKFPSPPAHPPQQALARQARDYMLANLHKPRLRVQAVADRIGLSRSQLYRIFYGQYGLSPVQFLEETRIRNACQLLKSTELSIQYVAASCGYEDPLYFSFAFKKRMGVSPTAYRAQWPPE